MPGLRVDIIDAHNCPICMTLTLLESAVFGGRQLQRGAGPEVPDPLLAESWKDFIQQAGS